MAIAVKSPLRHPGTVHPIVTLGTGSTGEMGSELSECMRCVQGGVWIDRGCRVDCAGMHEILEVRQLPHVKCEGRSAKVTTVKQ